MEPRVVTRGPVVEMETPDIETAGPHHLENFFTRSMTKDILQHRLEIIFAAVHRVMNDVRYLSDKFVVRLNHASPKANQQRQEFFEVDPVLFFGP